MPKFGKTSLERLATCHPDLQRLMQEVVKHVDCTILEGHRTKEKQNEVVAKGLSKTPWPQSKHNALPSLAVDAMPYPIDWQDTARMYQFVGFVRGVASQMGIAIRCGSDWDSDFEVKDQTFHDLPHIELKA